MEVIAVLKKNCMCCLDFCLEHAEMFSSRHFRFLICLSVFLCIIMPFLAINLPLSKLYEKYHKQSETLELAKQLNSARLLKALKYFNESDSKKSLLFYDQRSKKEAEVVVSIVTVSRNHFHHDSGYLIQTSSVIDSIIKSDTHFRHTFLFICNVDSNPLGHSDAMFIQQYIPYVQKYGTNSFGKTFSIPEFSSKLTDTARKSEFEDYVFCMNVSKSFGTPYVLMLEDDVVPYKNVFEILHYSVKQHNLQHFDHLDKKLVPGREFAFLKLYYPEKWQGYANEVDRILELVSLGVLGGAVLLAAASVCALSNSGLTYFCKLFYFTFGAFLTIVSCLIIGRQNVMSVRRLSPQLYVFKPTPGCCTPAMFYSSHVLSDLMQHLMTHSSLNKDLAINQFITQNNIPGYILEPNLFRHIGMYTSLNDAYKPPVEYLFDMP